tara:strand:- start:84 stop:476 length:393 start_codon:yes stop_codon:yes gene_type:complete
MPKKEEFKLDHLNEAISHYTDATRFGDLLFVSGCAPLDSDGKLVGGDDVAAQARRTLENVGAILEAAGATFADVLKVVVYLTDVNDHAAINPVRQEFFGTSKPCSTLIGINELIVPGMKVEIEAIAGIPS